MAKDITKTDMQLGEKIKRHLIKCGVETPMDNSLKKYSNKVAINKIAKHFEGIMQILQLDLSNDSLKGTPMRMGKMYVNEIFYGLDYSNFPKITMTKCEDNNMVIERNINVASNCEHHLVVVSGKAHIGYIPNEKNIGLSKLNRIVEFFSKRPTIQERLVKQIKCTLQYLLGTDNVAVVIGAEHHCVKSRGVEDEQSDTITASLGGIFMKDEVKKEFYTLLNMNFK